MHRTELPLLVDEYGARLVDELDFRLEVGLGAGPKGFEMHKPSKSEDNTLEI